MATGQLFYDPVARPLSSAGATMPLCYYNFYASGTTTPAAVYQDSALTLPFPTNSAGLYVVTADSTGAFPPIFLNPVTIYRVQLYNAANTQLEDVDPFVPSFPVTGSGPITLDAQGELTINQPSTGGTGVALTIVPSASGKSLQISGSAPGQPALVINNSVTVGTQTASMAANNKPGFGTTNLTLTVAPSGATYTGGTLTASFSGTTGNGYVATLSTGQVLTGCTLTNGSTTFTCPSSNITPTPTTTITMTSGVQKWAPIVADGGTYYLPLWL